MKNHLIYGLFLVLLILVSGCSGSTMVAEEIEINSQWEVDSKTTSETDLEAENTSETPVEFIPVAADYDPEDIELSQAEAQAVIRLEGEAVTIEGTGAAADGTLVTITESGVFEISGTLTEGQIVVDTDASEPVTLVLNGAAITCLKSAPIYAVNAEKVIITLAEGSENVLSDGATYILAAGEDEPNAAVFSKDDLTINGNGTLTVNAQYNNGIASKDDLKITGGTITVNAKNDGIKGKDSVAILDGNITINAGADAIQSTNMEEADKGTVSIEGGLLSLTSGLDGIQAETNLLVSGGELQITTGRANQAGESAKGLKAEENLTITGGVIVINALDDACHSNGRVTIDGGDITLSSGDDGIHAETALTINGGNLSILEAFEGLESLVITINDGTVHLVTSDDGLNASSGSGGEQTDRSFFYLNGGYVLIEADGDGVDSNGTAILTGGVVIIQASMSHGNGPLDVNGELETNGGLLLATGSSSMPEIPSTTSTQNSIALAFNTTQTADSVIHIENTDGETILTYAPPRDYQLFVFSSSEIKTNASYNLFIGGEAVGTITDGLYTDGTYSGGTQAASLDITSSVTTMGTFNSGFGGKVKGSRP